MLASRLRNFNLQHLSKKSIRRDYNGCVLLRPNSNFCNNRSWSQLGLQCRAIASTPINDHSRSLFKTDALYNKSRGRDWNIPLSSYVRLASSSPNLNPDDIDEDDEIDEDVLRFTNQSLGNLLNAGNTYGAKYDYSESLQHDSSYFEKNDMMNEKETPPTKKSMAELLSKFDPQSPPPLQSASLEDLQIWFECESQRESVLRYEKIINSARERKDFASLSTVQSQILRWYQPLRNSISNEQRSYIMGENRRDNDGEVEGKPTRKKDQKKYGPFLCTLQPEKLAVIVSHETTMATLLKGGEETLMHVANKIGSAVEAEVNVQALLKKRMARTNTNIRNDTDEVMSTDTQSVASTTIMDDNNSQEISASGEKMPDDTIITDDNKPLSGNWMYGANHLQQFIDEMRISKPSKKTRIRVERANARARKLLNSEDKVWTSAEKVKVGVALLKIFIDVAKIKSHIHNKGGMRAAEPAFIYEKRLIGHNKSVGFITMNQTFYKQVVEDDYISFEPFTTRHQPMIVPPTPWTGPKDGGYRALEVKLMRTHGCNLQEDALYEADLSTVLDGLNVLGSVPWMINPIILEAAQRCWKEGIAIGDIPSQKDFEVPPEPIRPESYPDFMTLDKESEQYKTIVEEYNLYREAMMKYRRIRQKNMDLRSLRCSAILKLDQADKFKGFDKLYFPYNLDFRGRTYPIPPHLSNVGSDLCRGMLTFAHSKPLGPRGLYWLKVHLANLAGADKMSFDDRAAFAEDNMENIRDCVKDPFGSNRWWMGLDDPFQALATCNEIVSAIDSGDPASYECSFPIHMDGSCNGLQHYAALGRDKVGGKAVNLCNYNKPQDVYIGVMHEVVRRVAEDAEEVLDFDVNQNLNELTKAQKAKLKTHRAAKLVNGLIDRGVVKRTVMTSVYGVTYIGARKQIQEKVEEKLEAQGLDVDEIENEIHVACGYLASMTMEVMGELFTGARQTMNWLATCARLISSQGQPVSWMSAIGVPAVQPYRQKKPYTITTILQSVVLMNYSDNLPLHKQRQASAFPPNYVHSLDSSHMLMTALEMDRRGLTFSAVHDSFWTHPCDIDEMNMVLRESFVDLYTKPLLEELKKTWELQYPSLEFPDLPERGDLDLSEVKDAPYFFQ